MMLMTRIHLCRKWYITLCMIVLLSCNHCVVTIVWFQWAGSVLHCSVPWTYGLNSYALVLMTRITFFPYFQDWFWFKQDWPLFSSEVWLVKAVECVGLKMVKIDLVFCRYRVFVFEASSSTCYSNGILS